MNKLIFTYFLVIAGFVSFSQNIIKKVEPSNWWIGMNENKLQLLIYGTNIAALKAVSENNDFKITNQHITENPNYLFLDIEISNDAKAAKYEIKFLNDKKVKAKYLYELKERNSVSKNRIGFDNSDAIYLLMPDRFANGNIANDNIKGMPDSLNRKDKDARHGGDIQGIVNNIDYIKNLGMTAIWVCPLLENNMPKYSYHGYATTDFYKVDPRYGTNEEYKNMITQCHQKGMKVIMDMIFNHCGLNHWWINDLPSKDWIHQFEKFTRTNYRSETIMDPYASDFDKKLFSDAWFDTSMPDLNQKNPFLANYLIQNSIWWIEYSGIDGIRMDTYPYSDQNFMKNWMHRINTEYPFFNVVGETWLQRESHTAWFQTDSYPNKKENTNLKYVTDFPLQSAMINAFNENDGWSEGLARLYYVLAQDFMYSDAFKTITFADNHDVSRYFSSINEDLDEWKMAMGFMLTTRGIPMIFYGTEILMTGTKDQGDGFIRKDFPGGWKDDKINAFSKEGRTDKENTAFDYLQKLLHYRQNHKALHNGKLTHYFPTDGTYVYFRNTENENIMIIMNNNSKDINLDLTRYQESIKNAKSGIDIITNKEIIFDNTLNINKKSILILELK